MLFRQGYSVYAISRLTCVPRDKCIYILAQCVAGSSPKARDNRRRLTDD